MDGEKGGEESDGDSTRHREDEEQERRNAFPDKQNNTIL